MSLRSISLPLAGLAAIAMLSGCGSTVSPTALDQTYDTTPPPAPGTATLSDDGAGHQMLVWSPSAAPDVASYQVYLYSPSPDRDNAYVIVSDPDPTDNSFALAPVTSTTDAIYRIKAVDAAGNKSAFSAPAEVRMFPVGGSGGGGRDPIEITRGSKNPSNR